MTNAYTTSRETMIRKELTEAETEAVAGGSRTLRSESTKLWNAKYAGSADLVGYLREWKQVLASDYGIDWNGRLGTYKACVW